jgi:uncharacterized protein (TIGR00288 family)
MSHQGVSIHRNCPTVAVAVDGQNVGLLKNGNAILKFASGLGAVSVQWAYYDYRKLKPRHEARLQDQEWQCVDVAVCTKNELDHRMMMAVRKLCSCQPPDILVLVTNDKDFAPLVEYARSQGIKVFVIGRRNGMSKKLKRLLSNGIVYIEDLKQLSLVS